MVQKSEGCLKLGLFTDQNKEKCPLILNFFLISLSSRTGEVTWRDKLNEATLSFCNVFHSS